VEAYNEGSEAGRSVVERTVLQDAVRPLLKTADPVDKVLDVLLDAIETHEECSSLLLGAFDAVRWALSTKGTLTENEVLADKTVARVFERTRKALAKQHAKLELAITRVESELAVDRKVMAPLRQMRADVSAAMMGPESLLSTLLERHKRVQKEKRKGEWIERGAKLTIMPSFGYADDPPNYSGLYLHPFRISNAYAMLGELGVVKVGVDEEED
jgi:hypothetical protein